MSRYYCSGFDIHNAFGNGLGEMFKRELKDTKGIVFVPMVNWNVIWRMKEGYGRLQKMDLIFVYRSHHFEKELEES